MQTSLLFGASTSFSRKQIKSKLMLCKPLFIIHGRVKGFLKVMLQYKNKVPPLQKWVWHMHNEIAAINGKLQVSVQILLYNKIINKHEINKNLKGE